MAIKKFIRTMIIGLQNTIVYRGNFLISLIAGLISLFANIIFWPAVYGVDIFNQTKLVSENISGYTLREMMSYALLVYILQWGIAISNTGYSIKMDIMTGKINYYLLKPYRYLKTKAIFGLSQQLLTFIISLGTFLLMISYMNVWIMIPQEYESWILITIAVILSYIISFQISCLVGMISFWILETSSLNVFIKGITLILSGAVFPLDFIGGAEGRFLTYLPFNFLIFFPTQLYLQKLSTSDIASSFIIAVGWIVVFNIVIKFLWSRGTKRYSSFGG